MHTCCINNPAKFKRFLISRFPRSSSLLGALRGSHSPPPLDITDSMFWLIRHWERWTAFVKVFWHFVALWWYNSFESELGTDKDYVALVTQVCVCVSAIMKNKSFFFFLLHYPVNLETIQGISYNLQNVSIERDQEQDESNIQIYCVV